MSVVPALSPANFCAENARKRRRTPVRNACTNCKKAHAACSSQRPCFRCVQYGLGSTCFVEQEPECSVPWKAEKILQFTFSMDEPPAGVPVASPHKVVGNVTTNTTATACTKNDFRLEKKVPLLVHKPVSASAEHSPTPSCVEPKKNATEKLSVVLHKPLRNAVAFAKGYPTAGFIKLDLRLEKKSESKKNPNERPQKPRFIKPDARVEKNASECTNLLYKSSLQQFDIINTGRSLPTVKKEGEGQDIPTDIQDEWLSSSCPDTKAPCFQTSLGNPFSPQTVWDRYWDVDSQSESECVEPCSSPGISSSEEKSLVTVPKAELDQILQRQKALEEALHNSNRELTRLKSQMDVEKSAPVMMPPAVTLGISIWKLSDRIFVDSNQYFADLCGHSLKELRNNFCILNLFPREVHPTLNECYSRLVRGISSGRDYSSVLDGRPVSISSYLQENGEGQFRYVIVVVQPRHPDVNHFELCTPASTLPAHFFSLCDPGPEPLNFYNNDM